MKYTLKPSGVISRDFVYRSKGLNPAQEVDLRPLASPVKDQGNLGACVPSAVISAYELLIKKHLPDRYVDLSTLFLYYNSRLIEETIAGDEGVLHIKNALKVAKLCGLARDSLWNYDESKLIERPSDDSYIDALSRRISSYKLVPSVESILENLVMDNPIIVGMDVFEGFDSITKEDPIVKMPWRGAYSMGGHSVLIVGYSLPNQQFIIKNSFGSDWGEEGYAYVPFDYVKACVFEAWTIDI